MRCLVSHHLVVLVRGKIVMVFSSVGHLVVFDWGFTIMVSNCVRFMMLRIVMSTNIVHHLMRSLMDLCILVMSDRMMQCFMMRNLMV